MTDNVRLMGGIKLLGGALVFAAILAYFMQHGLEPSRTPFKIIGPAIPGAFALVGLIELRDRPARHRGASAWDALVGWQRGILGALVVAVAFALMMGAVVLFA